MGNSVEAILAYGYDLGGVDGEYRIAEVDEDGALKLDWLGEDDDFDFVEEAETRLRAAAGFTETDYKVAGYFDRRRAAEDASGVEFEHSGSWDYAGKVLIAKGSERSVEWSDTMPLDLDELRAKPTAEWDAKLTAACTALGITPTQEGGPRWLVFPFYG